MYRIIRFSESKVRFFNFNDVLKWNCALLSSFRNFSYLHNGGEIPLKYKTVGDVLDEAAEKYGDKTALVSVYQGQIIKFGEVKKRVDEVASGLLELGIEKGDRIGLWAPNSVEWYIISFALAKAGAISVYLNPAYQSQEMKHCINAVKMKSLIMAESFKNQNYVQIIKEFIPDISKFEPGKIKSSSVPSLESIFCISEQNYSGILPFKAISEKSTPHSMKKLKELSKIIYSDDASNIQFTSGTTGSPKGAVLSHFNIVNNSYFTSLRQEFHLKEHIMCLMGPLFHAMGSVIGVLTCLHEGLTLVLPEPSFSPSKACTAIINEKCTVLLGTPTMYVDVLKVFTDKGLKATSPEIAITGGAFASTALIAEMREKLGVKRVASVYGLTETGPISFMSKPTDTVEQTSTTVGYIMNHTEAKVVDENGHIVPWNTPGELWVRGYANMKYYFGNEEKTRETITTENWLRTGDQFIISEDGYGRIVGRIKDMIIRGGENIFPADIEEYLSTHPDILEVQVVGVPDKRLGEQVCACIRLNPDSKLTENDVKEYCKGKISAYKIPHYVCFVDQYPKTSSGKVQKVVLRTEIMDYLKLTEDPR